MKIIMKIDVIIPVYNSENCLDELVKQLQSCLEKTQYHIYFVNDHSQDNSWKKLKAIGAIKPSKIITIGGGAQNPQWRRIRERLIGIPIQTCTRQPAEGVARIAIEALENFS